MKSLMAGAVLLSCSLPLVAYAQLAQASQGDHGEGVLAALAADKIPAPKLGWVLPNGELVTEVASKEVTFFAEKSDLRVAGQIGVVPANAVLAFVKKNQVDCDRADGDKPVALYRYDARMPPSKTAMQVLVVPGRLGTAVKAGIQGYKATDAELSAVWEAMQSKPGQRRLTKSIQQDGGTVFYTIAAIYLKDGRLLRQGIFLEDHSGKVLGRKIEDVNGEALCDGCAVLTYKNGLDWIYHVENLFAIAGLDYPVLLEDSSTVEGRAIDLFTFTASGQPSEFRLYEYMVTCILGADSGVTPTKQ